MTVFKKIDFKSLMIGVFATLFVVAVMGNAPEPTPEPTVREFIVVKGWINDSFIGNKREDLLPISKLVEEKLREGFQPLGGVSSDGFSCIQAMVRYK